MAIKLVKFLVSLRKICYAVNKEKEILLFRRKDMSRSNQKSCVFISGQNMWSKWKVGVFLKKLKSPETRLFQVFDGNLEDKIFELVYSVSRTHMHRFFV